MAVGDQALDAAVNPKAVQCHKGCQHRLQLKSSNSTSSTWYELTAVPDKSLAPKRSSMIGYPLPFGCMDYRKTHVS